MCSERSSSALLLAVVWIQVPLQIAGTLDFALSPSQMERLGRLTTRKRYVAYAPMSKPGALYCWTEGPF
jgi:hypothetical protein